MHTTPHELQHALPGLAEGAPLRRATAGRPPRAPFGTPPGDGAAPRSESRRVTTGFVALLALSFVMLNLGLYQSARSRLASERWQQLAASTEEKRKDVRAMIEELQNESAFIANQEEFRGWFDATADARAAAPDDRTALLFERELDQAASSFHLLAIDILRPDGTPLSTSSNAGQWRTPRAAELARRVSRSRHGEVLTELPDEGGKPVIVVAAPVRTLGDDAEAPVAVLYAGLNDRVRRGLLEWPIASPNSGAFLVTRRGEELVVTSTPPAGSGLYLGQRLPLTDRRHGALTVAAMGGESNIETLGGGGAGVWSVTRALPELGCALVGQADRSTLLAGMQFTLAGLLVLDLGVVVLVVLLVLMWRRHYRSRIARRELELTRRHAERIHSVLDNAFDAILSLDEHGVVVTANHGAERLFQRTRDELTGQPLSALLRGSVAEGLPRESSEDLGKITQNEAIRPDGNDVAVECSLACSRHEDGLFYTLVVRDTSARLEAERQVQAFAKGLEVSNRRLEEANGQLEQSSRLKSEFLANTSHELRTPLNGIMGFLQLVLDGLCDSPEEEREFLGQALQCSKHLLGLINDVLDIAKIEAGRLSLQVEPVSITGLFEEVYTVTRVQAQQKTLKLVFEPPGDACPSVRADFGKLKQVLINLVGNSLKFTHAGSITVRARVEENAGHCLFEVVDTGIGIPKDRQDLIFEKFIQADGSTTRRYGGTGLGLAITRSLVELMGGIIGVDSDGGGTGTRMFFSMPLWRGDEQLASPSDSGESLLPDLISGPGGGPLVLVVDDDSVFRRFVTALLQQHGYRTAEAAHAEAGWVLVRRLRPSLVLLDYALSCPEGAVLRTGWDLAERMGNDTRTRAIPFMFVTGFDAQLMERLKGVTFAQQPRHVVKPVGAHALLECVQDAIGAIPNRMIRVLLADDDPTVAAYVGRVLPAERFQVEVVNNGEECLHFLRTQPKGFDLLLLDLMMPDVSGYDVLRDMALTGTAKGLPVIVLTNEPEPRNESERRLLEQGQVLDILPKSSVHEHPELLPAAIDHHLRDAAESQETFNGPRLQVERFRAELPEGDAATARRQLGVERFLGPDGAAGSSISLRGWPAGAGGAWAGARADDVVTEVAPANEGDVETPGEDERRAA